MNLLLGTHAFLWFQWDAPHLSDAAKSIIMEPTNRKLISAASYWEIAIKISLKKLDLGAPYQGFIEQHMPRDNFEVLPLEHNHMVGIVDLPFHHRDPLDRMLVAQACWENIRIVSRDSQLDAYRIQRIW